MNNEFLKQLWQLANELEALILLADNKGQDSYENLFPILREKASELIKIIDAKETLINNHSEQINIPAINANQQTDAEYAIEEPEEDRYHSNLEDDYDDLFVTQELEDDRAHGNLEDDYDYIVDNPIIEQTSEQNTHVENCTENPQTDDITFEEQDEIICDFVSDETDDAIEIMDDDMTIVDNDLAIIDDITDSSDETIENVLNDAIDKDSNLTQLTVEGKIAISESKDLRHAFTINDRYRFKRELFANSDIEMNDTLNLISAMTTFSEAKEYFYEDLEWDRNNEDVIDFIAIIENHFASKQ